MNPERELAVPESGTIASLLESTAARYGDRTAIVTVHGRATFRELRDSARLLARGLIGGGIGSGDRVAVFMPNAVEWVTATYAVLATGAIPVLISSFSAGPELHKALEDTNADTLLMARANGPADLLGRYLDDASVGTTERRNRQAYCLGLNEDHDGVQTWSNLFDLAASVPDAAVEERLALIRPSDDGLILFTSGTSGSPKAVLHSQSAALQPSSVWAEQLDLTSSDRVFTTYPFCWSSGFCRLAANLMSGALLVTVDHFSPGECLTLMSRERVTKVTLPGPHLEARLIADPGFAQADLSSIVAPGGALLGSRLGLESTRPYNAYGLSEAFTLVTSTAGLQGVPEGSVGRPLPGWEVKILDPESNEPVPAGEVGRIVVRGPSLMRGYVGIDSDIDAAGYFRTPDLGYQDADGNLYFSSRIDDVVRSGGANVSAAELETLLSTYPSIRQSVALGVPHPTLGQALVLCVVPADKDLTEEDVREWLRPQISSYKLPRAILFVGEDDLTFTSTAKVRRGALRELAMDRLSGNPGWLPSTGGQAPDVVKN